MANQPAREATEESCPFPSQLKFNNNKKQLANILVKISERSLISAIYQQRF
jgi:hypothetical protein